MKPNEDETRFRSVRTVNQPDGGSPTHEGDHSDFKHALQSREALAEAVPRVALDEILKQSRPWGTQTRDQRIALARAAAQKEKRTRALMWASGLAAACMVAVLVGLAFVKPDSGVETPVWKTYASTGAEWTPVELEDGTMVRLAANTEISVSMTDAQRGVRMSRGLAFFKVTPDASRPFRVSVGPGVVQVRGTSFSIDYDGKAARVEVEEGHVTLLGSRSVNAPLDLYAGGAGSLLETGLAQKQPTEDATAVAVVAQAPAVVIHPFNDAPLPEIAQTFNQQQGRDVFAVVGSACTSTLSGKLNVADPNDLVAVVEATPKLALDRRADVMIIRGKTDSSNEGERLPCR